MSDDIAQPPRRKRWQQEGIDRIKSQIRDLVVDYFIELGKPIMLSRVSGRYFRQCNYFGTHIRDIVDELEAEGHINMRLTETAAYQLMPPVGSWEQLGRKKRKARSRKPPDQ